LHGGERPLLLSSVLVPVESLGSTVPRPSRRAGVYVHFPWCLAKCPYCDFVSYVPPGTPDGAPAGVASPASLAAASQAIDHGAYADAVLRELGDRAPMVAGRSIETVFFGGGTPSLWDPRELGRVLRGIRDTLDCADDLEVTVECNPTSIDAERARALVDQGVNRVSLGVQSLRDDRLRYLGRLHDAGGARAAVTDVLGVVPRVSADLIFGLPGQAPEEARDEAVELQGLGLSHVSCYQLTIEPGTRFGELARRGRLPLADEGAVAEAFLAIDEALGARGLAHYEVSNYARPGQEARHNLGYWRGDEYLGLGCAAYGFVMTTPGEGVRYRNLVLPERYLAADDCTATREPLDAATLMRERIMLGLRVAGGVDLEEAARALGGGSAIPVWTPERQRAAAWLLERGRIERAGSRVRVPRGAWLWTDDTAARLF
jgi:oxygen-independent coproporphyrinogen-3 oxidase